MDVLLTGSDDRKVVEAETRRQYRTVDALAPRLISGFGLGLNTLLCTWVAS